MRITVSFGNELLLQLKMYAQSRGITFSKGISELTKRGLGASHPTRLVTGIVVFDLPKDSPRVTIEQVRNLF